MNILEYATLCRKRFGAELSSEEASLLKITGKLNYILIVEVYGATVLLPYARVGKDTIINNYRYAVKPNEPWEYDEGNIVYILGLYSPVALGFGEIRYLRRKISTQFKAIYIRNHNYSRMWMYGKQRIVKWV